MGQFLGFSDEHSSLVADVKNSRQVMLALNFMSSLTTFENDMAVDAICNPLFESNDNL